MGSGKLSVSFWVSDQSFFIKTEQELKTQQPHHFPMRMQVNITADEHRGKRGYEGATVELPANPFELDDTIQRAQVPEYGGYELHRFSGCPRFLTDYLIHSGDKTLEELNLLAGKIAGMDEIQLETYEGALQFRQEGDILTSVSMTELINYTYNLDSFEFYPGIVNDYDLGEVAMMGGMLDTIDDLTDEVAELLDEQKVGKAMRRTDQGTYTGSGYVFRGNADWQEVYDGIYLPGQPEKDGLILLRLVPAGGSQEENSGVWMVLPANQREVQWVLDSLGETSLDHCMIAETESILPSLKYQLVGDEDIGKLNILAERLAEFPEYETLTKYKAVLELEEFPDLDRMLDIAVNLDCYDYDPMINTAAGYAEYLLKESGFDTSDPAFARFDFAGNGERQLERNGFVPTPYGCINRNDKPLFKSLPSPSRGLPCRN